jgi:hypothetical protein
VNCIPWDYPLPAGLNSTNLPTCNSFEGGGYNNSLLAFDNAMKDSNNTRNCEKMCLPNCDETTYDYTVDTTELKTEELCANKDTRKVVFMHQFLIM